MTDSTYVISGHTDADGEQLYWSNADGWVDRDSATVFSTWEMENAPLPAGDSVKWKIVGEERPSEYDPDSGPSDPYDESWRDNEIDERGLPEVPTDDSDWSKP